jgi:DNA-binding HxlR family transcriptional regulator
METNCYHGLEADNPQKKTDDLAREIIEKIADKWTILVIDTLGTHGEMRFSRLREEIGGVSQKMLTKTLRQLERDGLVSRYVHPVIPPRVDYQLTPLGGSLLEKVCGIWGWVESHMREMEAARRQFDLNEKSGNEAGIHHGHRVPASSDAS